MVGVFRLQCGRDGGSADIFRHISGSSPSRRGKKWETPPRVDAHAARTLVSRDGREYVAN